MSLVAGAVAAEAGQLPSPEDAILEPAAWLPLAERELGPDAFEQAGELVGAGAGKDWA